MKMSVVDFDRLVGSPQNSSGGKIVCKFIIVEWSAELSLVFGPVRAFEYHAWLLERFCRERQIAAGWVKKPDLVEVYDRSVTLHGGGWMELDFGEKQAEIYGSSTAYGPYRADLARAIIADHPHFARFRVKYSR
ncbi:hypothetical protein KQH82_12005 [bacterium]|nr:hypothetical protein [bacterium]